MGDKERRHSTLNIEKHLQHSNRVLNTPRTLGLILWKTVKIQLTYKRVWLKLTLLSLVGLFPVLLIRLCSQMHHQDKIIYKEVEIDTLDVFRDSYLAQAADKRPIVHEKLFYMPPHPLYRNIIARTVKKLGMKGFQEVQDYHEMNRLMQKKKYLAGVKFGNISRNANKLPNIFKYQLRFRSILNTHMGRDIPVVWVTDKLYPQIRDVVVRGKRTEASRSDYGSIPPGYMQEGFIALQHAIFMSYLEELLGNKLGPLPKLKMSRFPIRNEIYDEHFSKMKVGMPLAIMFIYLLPSSFMVKLIMEDKQRGIIQSVHVNSALNWLSWFIIFLLWQSFVTIISVLILSCALWQGVAIYTYSDKIIIILYMICYVCANITFLFMISVAIISRSKKAKYAMLVHFLTYVPYIFIFIFYYELPVEYKFLSCLFLNTGLAIGINIIIDFEYTLQGAQWDNIDEPHFGGDNFCLLHAAAMMLLSSLVYVTILAYMENKVPQDYIALSLDKGDITEHWYYPLTYLRERIRYILDQRRERYGEVFSFRQFRKALLKNLTNVDPNIVRPEKKGPKRRNVAVQANTETDVDILAYRPNEFDGLVLVEIPSSQEMSVSSESPELPELSEEPELSETPEILPLAESPELSDELSEVPLVLDPPYHVRKRSEAYPINNEPLFDNDKGIRVLNVSKSYRGISYLSNITLTIHPNEITAILGHQYSGQLLLSQIISGNIAMSSGTVIINGIDIRTKARKTIFGFMPKHSIIFNELTISENLYFFTHLRGVRNFRQVRREIRKYLDKLHLRDMADVLVGKLSYGMARRLCLCCALCGGDHPVICDEPSLGLDQRAKHHLWNLIRSEGRSRCIIITTLDVEDVNVLADRVALLNNGKIHCYDYTSNVFRYMCNDYNLSCRKAKYVFRQREIVHLIRRHIPNGIFLQYDTDDEITFSIPAEYVSNFPNLFEELHAKMQELGVTDFSIQLKSLSDVFVYVDNQGTRRSIQSRDEDILFRKYHYFNKPKLWHDCSVFKALCRKKYIYMKRNWWIPLIIFLGMSLNILLKHDRFSQSSQDLPKLNLSPDAYLNSISLLKADDSIQPGSIEDKLAKAYTSYQKHIVSKKGKKTEHSFKQLSGRREIVPYLLFQQMQSVLHVETFYVSAASIKPNALLCYWNDKLMHSAPISLYFMHNALIKALVSSESEVLISNYPIPFIGKDYIEILLNQDDITVGIGTVVVISFCAFTSLLIIPIIGEKAAGTRMHQIASFRAYWLAQFTVDLTLCTVVILYMTTLLLICKFVYGDDVNDLMDPLVIISFVSILFLFSVAVLPFVYLITLSFNRVLHGFVFTLFILLGSSYMILLMLPVLAAITNSENLNVFAHLFRWSPTMNLYLALWKVYISAEIRNKCKIRGGCKVDLDCCGIENIFDFRYPNALIDIAILVLLFILYSLALSYVHQDTYKRLRHRWDLRKEKKNKNASGSSIETPRYNMPEDENKSVDVDVTKERMRVDSLLNKKIDKFPPLVIHKLIKSKMMRANIRDVSFIVENGQIFGLAGLYGSGKSKIIQLIAGADILYKGKIFVNGINVETDLERANEGVGYCPRDNAFFEYMTVYEIFWLYCSMRGEKSIYGMKMAMELAEDFDLTDKINERISNLVYSDKRKVAIVIAVLGSSNLLLLDEPTRGMDPLGRQQVWRVIKKMQRAGYTTVLATDDIRECISICDRFAIMVNGHMGCLGSTQQLQSKFSQGSTVEIILAPQALSVRLSELHKYSRRSTREERISMDEGLPKNIQIHLVESSDSLNTFSSSDTDPNTYKQYQVLVDKDDEIINKATWAERAQLYKDLKSFMYAEIPGAVLKEEYQETLTYYIPFKVMMMEHIFEVMEGIKDILHVANYRVTRSSIVDLYKRITKEGVRFRNLDDRTILI